MLRKVFYLVRMAFACANINGLGRGLPPCNVIALIDIVLVPNDTYKMPWAWYHNLYSVMLYWINLSQSQCYSNSMRHSPIEYQLKIYRKSQDYIYEKKKYILFGSTETKTLWSIVIKTDICGNHNQKDKNCKKNKNPPSLQHMWNPPSVSCIRLFYKNQSTNRRQV